MGLIEQVLHYMKGHNKKQKKKGRTRYYMKACQKYLSDLTEIHDLINLHVKCMNCRK